MQDDEITPSMEGFYQEDEMPPPTIVDVDVDLDQVFCSSSTEVEEVMHEHVPTHPIMTINEDLEINEEEDSEEDEDDLNSSSSDNEWYLCCLVFFYIMIFMFENICDFLNISV